MASPQLQQVALKIAFNGDIHRTRVALPSLSLAQLTQLMAQTFRLRAGDFMVQYRDPEGDCVNVTTDEELQEAVRVFLSSADAVRTLKFSASTCRQLQFQEQVTDPLVQSVETLMTSLAVTLEQLKRDPHFASGAPSVAPDVALDQAARDDVESPESAAGGFSGFAQGLVGQINRFIPEKKAGEATAAPVAVPVSESLEQKPEEVQQPPVVQQSPPVVVEEAPPAQETEETPAIASSVAFSDSELKWAEQLSVVSSIFPTASPARVIDILEKSDGNLNVVLNVLTEET